MAHVDPSLDPVPILSSPPDLPLRAPPATTKPTLLVLLALMILLGFVAVQGHTLWLEWASLRAENTRARDSIVVGYYNINPNPSYAQKPEPWFHDEGPNTLLWSGWKHGVGHGWFRVGRGEVDRERLSLPMGRDVVQAIDYPIVEVNGGKIWGRIPGESSVVGQELGGVASVYPLQVLDKVQIVNDQVEGRAFLVVCNPKIARTQAVAIYDPVMDGHRLTMGMSGYDHDDRPLLYDRGTESLWVQEGDVLNAIAGAHRGARLRKIGQPSPTSWVDWCSHHPKSRLVVGADRSRTRPAL